MYIIYYMTCETETGKGKKNYIYLCVYVLVSNSSN